ncbi:MAG TPA: hypothetical protein DDW52_23550, partial [Planctomycetaceae bacterium]|nr:hypothetical protein [Planctomycetaceae bacterium]
NRFPTTMQNFIEAEVAAAHRRSVRAKADLKTKADAEQYVTHVQEQIAKCFGPKPERTPLNARVTGKLDRVTYTVEKIIFESRPNFPVTANFYLPKSKAKVPGVVGTCGHSSNGKSAEAYQSFAQGLARLGIACLIFDPIGQGERIQYLGENGRSTVGVGVREHIQAGNQQFLVGENLSMWRAWDGIRALDYLLTRTEIDPKHVGVTGNSGGGTMTTWLCGVEQRWTMAAPSCFVTTFLQNVRNELPADTEQCPPGVLAAGLEHEDFLIAQAPKPLAILAKERDFFDVRGAEAAFQRIKRVYKLLGAEDNVRLFVGPSEHGFSIENRQAMYECFMRATGRGDGPVPEPTLKLEADQDLWCTKTGQVDELKPATVFDFTAGKARTLAKQRQELSGQQLRAEVSETLRLPPERPPLPSYRILRDFGDRGFPRSRSTAYALKTEGHIDVICYRLSDQRHLSRPPSGQVAACLFVSHRSADAELRSDAWLRSELEKRSGEIYALDVRGVGETMPNTCGIDTFDDVYGCDYFYAAQSVMLDRPYLGQKVLDVLQTIRWINQFGASEIELVAFGWGALVSTLAAVLESSVSKLTIDRRVESFTALATQDDYQMPLAYLPPGVLERFDLPDCDRLLGQRLS